MDPIMMMLMGGMQLGGNLFGSAMSSKFNMEQIEQQEAFQERMSSTAFQRASRDMQAAGINPIMAFGHPASAPSGGAAQMQAPELGTAAAAGITAAQGIARAQQEIETQKAQASQLDELTRKTKSEGDLVRAQTAKTEVERGILEPEQARAKYLLESGWFRSQTGRTAMEAGASAHEYGRGGAAGLPSAFTSTGGNVVNTGLRGMYREGEDYGEQLHQLIGPWFRGLKRAVGSVTTGRRIGGASDDALLGLQ